jgi:hypothetical protein
MDQPRDTLCSYCEVLRIDDLQGTTRKMELENGDEIDVLFDDKYRSPFYRIEYQRNDYYPDFPVLKSSAQSSCAFCGILRATIRQKCGETFNELLSFSNDKRMSLKYEVIIHNFRYFREDYVAYNDCTKYKDWESHPYNLLVGSVKIQDADQVEQKTDGQKTPRSRERIYFDVQVEKGFVHHSKLRKYGLTSYR